MSWVSDRIVITRYAIGLLFAGVTCLFGTKSYWKEVVKFNKEWHNELHSVSRMVK